MNIETQVISLQHAAESISVDGLSLVHFETSTPAHKFDFFNRIFDTYYLQIRARDGYDEKLVAAVFRFLEDFDFESLPKQELTVIPFPRLPYFKFTHIGIAPPLLAECFKNQSASLEKIGYWIFPLLNNEFMGGESASDFRFDIGNKGRRIKVIDMNRPNSSAIG
jgi:hypothetical protein